MKALGESGLALAADEAIALERAAAGLAPAGFSSPQPARPPYTPLIAHAVQLAAIAALGEANDDAYNRLTYLTDEVNTKLCLQTAKLALNECLAVAGPHYEDIFCLGQHVMLDTGACLARYAGVGVPLEVTPAPLKIPAPGAAARRPVRRRR